VYAIAFLRIRRYAPDSEIIVIHVLINYYRHVHNSEIIIIHVLINYYCHVHNSEIIVIHVLINYYCHVLVLRDKTISLFLLQVLQKYDTYTHLKRITHRIIHI